MIAPTLWIEITIAGAIYLFGTAFIALATFGVADPRVVARSLEPFLPYIAAAAVGPHT